MKCTRCEKELDKIIIDKETNVYILFCSPCQLGYDKNGFQMIPSPEDIKLRSKVKSGKVSWLNEK